MLILSQEPESAELTAWLTLLTAPGLSPALLFKLQQQWGSASRILAKAPAHAAKFKIKDHTIDSWRQTPSAAVEHARLWLQHPDNHLILIDDPRYPQRLLQLSDPPCGLFCQGDLSLLQNQQLAMVGSRNPTPAGLSHARLFACDLASRGLTITSGLATGIDAAAHQGALQADGLTVAVIGSGLDRIYPASNVHLAAKIRESGLIISEFPPGTAPKRENFPRRNRLIAGLSLGTLVIEAALRSGSLITARLASELGREVFAMPGSVDNPMARGCHMLIRQGAKLVETAADILEELAPLIDNVPVKPIAQPSTAHADEYDQDYQQLLKYLDNAPRSMDQLVEQTGYSVDALSSMLLILELQGAVGIAPGGGYQKLR